MDEERRHQDNLCVMKEQNRWSKWGVIITLITGGIAIIIGTLAYLKPS